MDDCQILAAWAEKCKGPGWSNTIIWYVYYDRHQNRHYVESLQLDDPEVHKELDNLVGVSHALNTEMTRAVKRLVCQKGNQNG